MSEFDVPDYGEGDEFRMEVKVEDDVLFRIRRRDPITKEEKEPILLARMNKMVAHIMGPQMKDTDPEATKLIKEMLEILHKIGGHVGTQSGEDNMIFKIMDLLKEDPTKDNETNESMN